MAEYLLKINRRICLMNLAAKSSVDHSLSLRKIPQI